MTSLTLQLFHNLLSKRYLICPPFRGKPIHWGFGVVECLEFVAESRVGRESARAVPPIESSVTLVTLDPFIQKSIDPIIQYLSVKYLFITLKYDSSDLKENGTIPF